MSQKQLQSIVRAAIHPAIGLARVGNSPKEYYIGPEVPGQPALPEGSYKDGSGALKRQAARFRIYGLDQDGKVVAELTAENAEIEWTVHLANKKAAWYQFQMAMDIEEASLPSTSASRRRNPFLTGGERKKLVIDPGRRKIKGCNTEGVLHHFDSGAFMGTPVNLGELKTDAEGRLLVLGGFGRSASIAGQPPLDFANNDGWYDDISDGPVDAVVKIGEKDIPVTGAWIAVGPPVYAPALKTVRTLYDVMYDLGLRLGWYKAPEKLTFTKHIQPIFQRLTGLQWVNQGFASVFGAEAPYDEARLRSRLADASAENQEFRQQIVRHFRRVPTSGQAPDTSLWPYFYGDSMDDASFSRALASLTKTQLNWLDKWGSGNVEDDLATAEEPPQSLAKVDLAEQPALLDQAALDFCLADAFHPGCELTWVMRSRRLYEGPLRLRRRPAELPEADYGDVLAPEVAISPTGPLSMSAAGDLTRWMAIPWQTDTASCLSGYAFFETTENLPTFWPARVPNQVLAKADYDVVMDTKKSAKIRLQAFRRRRDWFRGFVEPNDITQMVTDFYKLGVVEELPGPTDLPGVPSMVLVESRPGPDLPLPEDTQQEKEEVTGSQKASPAAAQRYALRRTRKQRQASNS